MNEIRIVIYHPEMGKISEDTFTKLLKSITKIVREAHFQELLYILYDCKYLDDCRERLLALSKRNFNHGTPYYIETVRRGSLELTITATAFAIYFLDKTLGTTISESWRKTQSHKILEDHLSTRLWMSNYLKSESRRENFVRDIETVLDNWDLDGFEISELKDKEIDGDREIRFSIKEKEGLRKPADIENIDTNSMIERLRNVQLDSNNNTK